MARLPSPTPFQVRFCEYKGVVMDFVLVGLTLLALYLALFRLILAPRDQSGQHKKPLATVALAVVVVLVMYRGLRVVMSPSAPITMMRSELAKFTGQDGGPIYLALRGRIYDVSSGRSHYGPGGGYAGFSGRDASRSFVDLCFTRELQACVLLLP